MTTPLPPTTIHTTTPIPSSSAHDFLSAYLDRATTDPALQPDASITEHGPTSRTTASAPNLALHNLKRVQAGLGGEVLGRDLLLGEDGPAENGAGGGTGDNDKDGGDEWEEAKQYEQEQGQDADGNEQADSGAVDKEERKRKKKERRLEEKRAKSGGGEA
jgi:hypothetical protein